MEILKTLLESCITQRIFSNPEIIVKAEEASKGHIPLYISKQDAIFDNGIFDMMAKLSPLLYNAANYLNNQLLKKFSHRVIDES